MYFIMLFIITMKRQLKHMIKHKYVPWTAGKKKFQGKDDKGDVSFGLLSHWYIRENDPKMYQGPFKNVPL